MKHPAISISWFVSCHSGRIMWYNDLSQQNPGSPLQTWLFLVRSQVVSSPQAFALTVDIDRREVDQETWFKFWCHAHHILEFILANLINSSFIREITIQVQSPLLYEQHLCPHHYQILAHTIWHPVPFQLDPLVFSERPTSVEKEIAITFF